MSEFIRLTDEDIANLAAPGVFDGCTGRTSDIIRSLAEEVLRNRRAMRKDSRRAEQIKKCRWVLENALAKIEALELIAGSETKGDVLSEAAP